MQLTEQLRTAINNYLEGKASPEETQQVNEWYYAFNDSEVEVPTDEPDLHRQLETRMKNRLLKHIRTTKKKTPFMSRYRIAAAAAILLLVLAGSYFWLGKSSKTAIPAVTANIEPGTHKAVLTLGDGSTITLDSSGKHSIRQAGSAVNQQGAQLQYTAEGLPDFTYNTLSTPRGGQFQVRLADGTKVWLNAASSIRYPTSFTATERVVEITGEAYFEVAKDAAKPFLVKVNQAVQIEVLGTHFNINAYPDEMSIKTTLLEGAVKISAGNENRLLKPGQQARIQDGQPGVSILNDVNTQQVIAWKNGTFNIHNLELEEVMRQLARWYDIEVVYEKEAPRISFWGEMGRNENLSVILDFLQESGARFRFEKEGKKVIVTK